MTDTSGISRDEPRRNEELKITVRERPAEASNDGNGALARLPLSARRIRIVQGQSRSRPFGLKNASQGDLPVHIPSKLVRIRGAKAKAGRSGMAMAFRCAGGANSTIGRVGLGMAGFVSPQKPSRHHSPALPGPISQFASCGCGWLPSSPDFASSAHISEFVGRQDSTAVATAWTSPQQEGVVQISEVDC